VGRMTETNARRRSQVVLALVVGVLGLFVVVGGVFLENWVGVAMGAFTVVCAAVPLAMSHRDRRQRAESHVDGERDVA
jgi:drug/metabolite transporter (DMT)-like permease